MYKFVLFSVVSFLSAVVLADNVDTGTPATPPPPPKSPAAKAVISRHDAAVAKAREAFYKALIVADEQEAKDLHPALVAATKAGNLDEANAIKAASDAILADAKQQEAALSDGQAVADPSVKYVVWHFGWHGGGDIAWLMPDGSAVCGRRWAGTWKRDGDLVRITWVHGEHVDNFTFVVDASGRPIRGVNDAYAHDPVRGPFTISSVGSDATGEPAPPDPSK